MCVHVSSSQQLYEVHTCIQSTRLTQMTTEVTLEGQGPSASKVGSHNFKLGSSQSWLGNLNLEGNQLGPERG